MKRRSICRAATTLGVRGQVDTMQTSFRRLGFGMVFAILLVYLLMVVNFQSWLDPFIILTALPGAFAGILLDALCHADDAECAVADGRDHGDRRGDREQHSAGEVRQRRARRRERRQSKPRFRPGTRASGRC